MIAYKQAHTKEEIRQILALQKQNLPKNLSEKEIREQGFLTVEHSFDLLWEMNQVFPHTLATKDGKVIGYALSMTPKFALDIPILKSLFEEIKKVFKGKEFIVMGQICVAKTHRGQGVFRELYKNMQGYTQDTFDSIITEVDVKNSRSMSAHKAVGFKELSRHASDGKVWSMIVL
ncbi:MAG: GNAT family N-acetyltransferase, partial [Bacteroidota bacterium]